MWNMFYIVNKCSFSGLTESSSFSAQASDSNFSIKGINNLKYYSELIKNWKITNLIRVMIEEEGQGHEWVERLPFILGVLRTMRMEILGGHSPMEVVMGIDPF